MMEIEEEQSQGPAPNPLLSDEILDRLNAIDDKWKNMIPNNDQRCLVFEGMCLAIQSHLEVQEGISRKVHINDLLDLFLVVNPKSNSVVRKRQSLEPTHGFSSCSGGGVEE